MKCQRKILSSQSMTTKKDIDDKKKETVDAVKADIKKDRKKLILYSEIMKPKFAGGKDF